MDNYVIKNAQLVNEGKIWNGDVHIRNERIERIDPDISIKANHEEIIAEGLILIPGVIDDQVHFREPGLTHKAEIATESKAAVAGGTTTFMEMPNTKPPALTFELLEQKYQRAKEVSPANYSFFMGVSNENAEEALKINQMKNDYCGLKIFMGSSTGNMLVDNHLTLNHIFAESEVLIATHCEKEGVIRENLELAKESGRSLSAKDHPVIRDVDGCFASSFDAVQLAMKNDTRLHILHISTEKELSLFSNMLPLEQKRITAEVCVHHLNFTADDYEKYGNQIKCNPAIKEASNREALWEALLDNRLDIIATDHAPHTWEEKSKDYLEAPSGVPLVQHSLLLMLQYVKEGRLSLERLVEKMCHAPAQCFQVKERGYLCEGYFADLVLVDPNKSFEVTKENLEYKCNWSPFEGHTFPHEICTTFVSGHPVYNEGKFDMSKLGKRISFDRV